MPFDPRYYINSQPTTGEPTSFEGMKEKQFRKIVDGAAVSDRERKADALTTADSYCFQLAHPEFKRTAKNTKLMNHWLSSNNITNPTFPDFVAGLQALAEVLDIDSTQEAPKTFTGVFTKQEFNSLDEMIAAERAASPLTPMTAEERSLEQMPAEKALALLREGERQEQSEENARESKLNADGWISLHPEYTDSINNGKLMAMQLRTNGCEGVVSVSDYERADRQLRASGLLHLNQTVLREQEEKAVHERAVAAVNTPGSIFDKTTEEEMYALPMEELRKRGDRALAGIL